MSARVFPLFRSLQSSRLSGYAPKQQLMLGVYCAPTMYFALHPALYNPRTFLYTNSKCGTSNDGCVIPIHNSESSLLKKITTLADIPSARDIRKDLPSLNQLNIELPSGEEVRKAMDEGRVDEYVLNDSDEDNM
ncbi:unnamed protein product [Phytomonas sp. Hart1]|nr:unnamed protein product [Phytomonas sp. Hart1]|eukprot:CCW70424.1 unnamed protein product [Phytomonas sp. isolate Hart1]